MWNLKRWYKWIYLWNRNKIKDIENGLMVAKREGYGGRMDWEFGVSRCKLLYIKWISKILLYSTVQFSQSITSDSLWFQGLQHTRLPCPSPTSRACSNSSPSSWWCHPIISSSVVSFSSFLQSFQASGSFPLSQFFASWPKYWSFSFSISPSTEYSGLISFRIDWFHLLAVQRTFNSLLQYHSSKASILRHSAFFVV